MSTMLSTELTVVTALELSHTTFATLTVTISETNCPTVDWVKVFRW